MAGHRPFLIDSTNEMLPDGDQPVATQLREAFEDLFLKQRVSSVPVLHTCSQPTQLCSHGRFQSKTPDSVQLPHVLQSYSFVSTSTAAGPLTNVAMLLACSSNAL